MFGVMYVCIRTQHTHKQKYVHACVYTHTNKIHTHTITYSNDLRQVIDVRVFSSNNLINHPLTSVTSYLSRR